ncbi:hypothetical protein H7H37_11155, partial [Mycolicibacterium insubricum]|nr:hypothetical protein [Mycolicibacterium insubricum]
AVAIGVPPEQLRRTADRFNELARAGHDDDFDRGDSAYDNYYGDPTTSGGRIVFGYAPTAVAAAALAVLLSGALGAQPGRRRLVGTGV